jgi:type III pantothenate kinase
MNLIIDIGNTRGKFACFNEEDLLITGQDPLGWQALAVACRERGDALDVLLACTGPLPAGLETGLRAIATRFLQATPSLPRPLVIDYDAPETLGIDRVAGAIAAAALYPGHPLLVVDAGSAVTFNHVSADGHFLGGHISPGARLRFRSLHEFTERLPLVDGTPSPLAPPLEKNTRDAIREGVTRGILFEIRGHADAFRHRHPDGILLLTGGDSPWLSAALPDGFILEENLVMIGLNHILQYQKKHES